MAALLLYPFQILFRSFYCMFTRVAGQRLVGFFLGLCFQNILYTCKSKKKQLLPEAFPWSLRSFFHTTVTSPISPESLGFRVEVSASSNLSHHSKVPRPRFCGDQWSGLRKETVRSIRFFYRFFKGFYRVFNGFLLPQWLNFMFFLVWFSH